jgi:hypothetical protein
MSTRSSGHDGIEPIKHFLKKYLSRARLTMLASAFTCRKQQIFFTTSQGVVQILATAASPIVFGFTHKCRTPNIFGYVGE